jgi:hypothetical protein
MRLANHAKRYLPALLVILTGVAVAHRRLGLSSLAVTLSY